MKSIKFPSILTLVLMLMLFILLYETLQLGRLAAVVPLSILYVVIPLMMLQVGIEFFPSLESFSEKIFRLELGNKYSDQKKVAEKSSKVEKKPEQATVRYGAVAGILSVPFGIIFFGFLPAIVVFYTFYLRKVNGSTWVSSLLITSVFAGLVYFFFWRVLQVPLYPGILIPWMGF